MSVLGSDADALQERYHFLTVLWSVVLAPMHGCKCSRANTICLSPFGMRPILWPGR